MDCTGQDITVMLCSKETICKDSDTYGVIDCVSAQIYKTFPSTAVYSSTNICKTRRCLREMHDISTVLVEDKRFVQEEHLSLQEIYLLSNKVMSLKTHVCALNLPKKHGQSNPASSWNSTMKHPCAIIIERISHE